MEASDKLKTVTSIILISFVAALFFHAFMTFYGFGYPLNTFLFLPADRFNDFFNTYKIDLHLDPYFSEYHQYADYFPLAYLVFLPFTWLPNVTAFALFTALFCGYLYWFMLHYTAKIGAHSLTLFISIFFLSYPVLFCLDRSNLDNLLFIIVSLSIITFINKKYFLSSFLLAVATGMKLYPGVFIILFIKEKRWRECIYFVIFTVLLSFLTLTLFKTKGLSINVHRFSEILANINQLYLVKDLSLSFSSSLFQLIKIVIWYLPPFNHDTLNIEFYLQTIKSIQFYYFLFCIFSFLLISTYVVLIEKTRWKQVMLLTLPMILFPFISGDYKLIFLFIPFFLFIANNSAEKYDRLYAILFALLFIPKNYFFIPGALFNITPTHSIYSLMEFFNVTIMMFFLIIIIISGVKAYR